MLLRMHGRVLTKCMAVFAKPSIVRCGRAVAPCSGRPLQTIHPSNHPEVTSSGRMHVRLPDSQRECSSECMHLFSQTEVGGCGQRDHPCSTRLCIQAMIFSSQTFEKVHVRLPDIQTGCSSECKQLISHSSVDRHVAEWHETRIRQAAGLVCRQTSWLDQCQKQAAK